MAALIGALRVSLSADTAKFDEGMRRARTTAHSTAGYIKTSLGGVGVSLRESFAGVVGGLVAGLGVGLFTSLIKQSLEYAGSLAETAQQIGVTAKDLQTLRFAAGQVGVSQEQLQVGLTKLTITLGKVAAGAEAPAKALKAIGISVDDIKGKDTGEAFRIIADGLKNVTDRSQRAAVEVALFGKSGAALDNLLSGGSTALNQLTDAAEKLGIVLSDEQIRNADDTADKLEALKTVLSANIAGVVADNAGAILDLANALVVLVNATGQAVRGWQSIIGEISSGLPILRKLPSPVDLARGLAGDPQSLLRFGKDAFNSVSTAAEYEANGRDLKKRMAYNNAKAMIQSGLSGFGKRTPAPGGGDIGKFLAPKAGGSHHIRADHSAEKALRDSFQFDQDLRRSQQDVLRAQQDLAKTADERSAIAVQLLDSDKASFEAELQYKVSLNKLTQGKDGLTEAQAAQLRAQNDIKDSLERQKVVQDRTEEHQRQAQDAIEKGFDRQRDTLESQAAIATTAAERRKIELQLLDLAYQQRKQTLQNIIDTSKDQADIANARKDLASLDANRGNERQGVLNQTRGPLEEWAASVPKNADEINEAFQSIEVDGLGGLVDALGSVIDGTESLKDAFSSLAKSIISDIVKMSLKMLVFRALSSVFGSAFGGSSGFGGVSSLPSSIPGLSTFSIPGSANGNVFRLRGFGGTDRNMLSVNGLPLSRVSAGERVSISKDGANDGGLVTVNQHFAPNFSGNAATREDLIRMGQITKEQTIAAFKEIRRRSP